jgi:hypothetical protein
MVWNKSIYRENGYANEVPNQLRSLLYCTFHFISNPRHAEWQAGRVALRATDR